MLIRRRRVCRRVGRARRVGRPRIVKRRRRKQGRGLWDLIKKGHNWLRSNKIISTVGNALSGVPGIGSIAGTIGRTAATLGYGRRRRVGRPRVRRSVMIRRPIRRRRRRVIGGSWRSVLGSVHKFAKDKRLVSGALSHFGHPKLAGIASSLGYGRRIGGSLIDPIGAVRF